MKYRRFEPEDRMPIYRLFRSSLWDYLLQSGVVDAAEFNDIDESLARQEGLLTHLEQTAAQDWVAEDQQGLVGWARSVERGGHLQLTHFFVRTSAQGKGVGRALLDRAFPANRGPQRSVIATTNPRAVSLYLNYGVYAQGLAFGFEGPPKERPISCDLEIEQATVSTETLQRIVDVDSNVLGYRREIDIEYFMNNQPAFLFIRNGVPVAYAFGSNGASCGPAACLESKYLPYLLQQIERSACTTGQDSLYMTIPAQAREAVDWALAAGYRMDPFFEILLNNSTAMSLDRYIMTDCAFIW